jgi:PhoH-like ATPase
LKRRSLSEPGPAAAGSDCAKDAPQSEVRRLFVLDTNVLMHDPTAIYRFEEHDVYLPMVVLEELDAHKKGLSEASRNARQISRFLDDMIRGATKERIDGGLPLPTSDPGNHGRKRTSGRLFFQTRQLKSALPPITPSSRKPSHS